MLLEIDREQLVLKRKQKEDMSHLWHAPSNKLRVFLIFLLVLNYVLLLQEGAVIIFLTIVHVRGRDGDSQAKLGHGPPNREAKQ